MSSGGVTAERNIPWRRSSAQGSGQQQPSNRSSSGNNAPRDRSSTPSKGANTQEGSGRGQGQAAQRGGKRDAGAVAASNAKPTPSQAQVPTAAGVDSALHVPINGFNADDVKSYMKKTFAQAVTGAGGDEKALQVKLVESAQSKKTAPWGARPNQTSSGQNFWIELAKQIKAQEEQSQKSNAPNQPSRKGN